MQSVQFSVPGRRFGPDHVMFTLEPGDEFVRINHDSRDMETIWRLEPDRWQPFLDRIGHPDADSVIDGVRRAVSRGAGAEVLKAASEFGQVVFANIDWDLGMTAFEPD